MIGILLDTLKEHFSTGSLNNMTPNQHRKSGTAFSDREMISSVFLSLTLFSHHVNAPLRVSMPAIDHPLVGYLVVSSQRRRLESLK